MQAESTIIKNMPMPSEAEVKECLRTILSDINSYTSSLNYAVGYAKQGLHIHGEELRVQCLYVVNNIAGWRHPASKEIRRKLRKFGKGE